MSTPNQATNNTDNFEFVSSAVQTRPQFAITGVITGLGDHKETASGDYVSVDIIFKPTRKSKKIFPKLLFRPEMFSRGFDPQIYKNYAKYPQLASRKKKLTQGEVFELRYRTDVMPTVTQNKKTGDYYADQVTALMAICGGTVEGLRGIYPYIGKALAAIPSTRGAGDFGLVELTPDEILDVLKSYLAAAGENELLAIAKQSHDMETGAPTDRYELARWVGPLTQNNIDNLERRAEKTADSDDISRRLVIGYTL